MARAYNMLARADAVEKRRRRVIEAAMDLFAQRPFDLVSLADVASASGIALATVVRHFETKEQLFADAVAAARQVLDPQTDTMPENDPAAWVQRGLEAYERFGDVIVRLIAQEDRVSAIREVTEHGRKQHAKGIKRAFSGVLGRLSGRRRKVRFAQLMAVTDVLLWKLLRRDLGLSRGETEQAMAEIIESLSR
jgi:AcrR family transcriptional regulator